jgi:hypothetical protein
MGVCSIVRALFTTSDFIGFTSHENSSSSLSRILFAGIQSVRFGPNSTIEPAIKTSQQFGS